ncbi:MAG: baseplate J/gp47 family protein [bacterium]
MAFVERNYQEVASEILSEIVADKKITDINIGSVTRTIVEALSREIALLYSQLDRVYLSAFVDTAEGKSLDFVISILGLERRTADHAFGKVTFSRNTPAPADITIPSGTVVTGADLPNFETIESATLCKGKKEVEVDIRATIAGEKGRVEKEKKLTIMPKPVLGIEKLTNESDIVLGVSDETDAQLRLRAKNLLAGIGKATIDAIKFAAMSQGAKAVIIHEMPQGIPGEINVVIDCMDDKKAKILEAVETTRAAGIRVNPLFVEKVMIDMYLRIILDQSDLLKEEVGKIERKIREKITEYTLELKPGEKVLANKIVALSLSAPNVHNAVINKITTTMNESEDTTNRVLKNNDIIIGKFEKAELGELSFETTFMTVES